MAESVVVARRVVEARDPKSDPEQRRRKLHQIGALSTPENLLRPKRTFHTLMLSCCSPLPLGC